MSFKLMYGGEGGKKVALDPAATKMVFYFNEKQDAVDFGDYLDAVSVRDSGLASVSAEANHEENYLPQQTWQGGLIVLGKGTREERRDVTRRLQRHDLPDYERQRLKVKAENLSILNE